MFDQAFNVLKNELKAEVMDELKSVLESEEQRYVTIAEAAKYIGCSYEMVRTLSASGAFRILALGTQKRGIDKRDIDAYMASLKLKQRNG